MSAAISGTTRIAASGGRCVSACRQRPRDARAVIGVRPWSCSLTWVSAPLRGCLRPLSRSSGESAELAALEASLAAARREFAAVEVVGEPGIGKTRLLAELEAARGRPGLPGPGRQRVRARGRPAVRALRRRARRVPVRARAAPPRRARRRDARGARARLPRARRRCRRRCQERYRLHRAVRALLEELATPKPLVLILDDLHWADSGSLELLGSLLRRPPAAPVLLALAVRPRQVPERLAAALERIDAGRAGRLERGGGPRARRRRRRRGVRRQRRQPVLPRAARPRAAPGRRRAGGRARGRRGPARGRRRAGRRALAALERRPRRARRAPPSPATRSSPSWPPRRRA